MNERKRFPPLETRTSKGVSKGFLTGFTLIELLVVISIIALLLSVLMPALSKAKQAAYAAICKENLHQWSLIWKFYVDEYEDKGDGKKRGFFPNRDALVDWPESIRKYYWKDENPKTLFEMLLCPAAKKTADEGGRNPYLAWDDDMGDYLYKGSYVINLWSANNTGSGKVGGDRQLFWQTPYNKGASYAPIMLDGQWKDSDPVPQDAPPEHENDIWTPNAEEMRRACLKRHGDYVNALFMDFTVRRVGLKELWEIWWHQGWPVDRPAVGPPTEWDDPSHWMHSMKDFATD